MPELNGFYDFKSTSDGSGGLGCSIGFWVAIVIIGLLTLLGECSGQVAHLFFVFTPVYAPYCPSLAHKNESYDTIGIAAFVLFLSLKTIGEYGFLLLKRLVSIPAIWVSIKFRLNTGENYSTYSYRIIIIKYDESQQ